MEGSGSTLTMTGGEISGNAADFGGGVSVNESATFDMTGGKLSGNTATSQGGTILSENNSTVTVMGKESEDFSEYDEDISL